MLVPRSELAMSRKDGQVAPLKVLVVKFKKKKQKTDKYTNKYDRS